MTSTISLRTLLGVTASMAVLALAHPAAAQQKQFNVRSQDAASAIQELARQADVQILVSASLVPRITTPEVRGRYDVQTALARLIAELRLQVISNNGATIVLGAAKAPAPAVRATPVNYQTAATVEPHSAAPPAPPPVVQEQVLLSDIVVTATRQSDTVSRVPLSISAVTQRSLDQQGVKSTADLQRIVPSLTIQSQSGGVTNLAIRGIVTTSGAATTGVYINDTPLQKRFVTGSSGITGGNGSPTPPLFDLERVEVLRGPQGTLYGGSSLGGTIRFITPEPSLTRYSGYARTEVSQVEHGGASYEGGVAVGGPIFEDKLGFRASIYGRKTGGYIDMLDPYANGAVRYNDANSRDALAARLAVKFAPTDRSSITLSHYRARQTDRGGPDFYTSVFGGNNSVFTTTEQCFDTSRNIASGPSPTAAVACPAVGAPQPANIYRRKAQTYGPFNYLDDKYGAITQPGGGAGHLNPAVSSLYLTDMTVDYDFGPFTLKSISSVYSDKVKSFQTSGSTSSIGTIQRLVGYPVGSTPAAGATSFPLNVLLPFGANAPGEAFQGFSNVNTRHGISQEVRLASAANAKPLSWVLGAFYSHSNGRSIIRLSENLDYVNRTLYGIAGDQRYVQINADGTRTPIPAIAGVDFARLQNLSENEEAVFGEANYWITSRIKATAGVRVSRNDFTYDVLIYGPLAGYLIPTKENGAIGNGRQKSTPVTPKFGLQYQLDDNNMIYASASKGFRPGGVNSPVSEGTCGPGLGTLGLKVRDIPQTFDPDTVWAYEGGAKLRLLGNRVQVNTSVFRIDWNQVQLAVPIPGCGNTYARNAGTARSQGFDLQGQARLAPGLVADFSAGYTDAKYTQSAFGPQPLSGAAASPIALAGQHLPVPPVQLTLGAQYNFEYARTPIYARVDYQFSSAYDRNSPAGLPTYSPDTLRAPSTQQVNIRVGATLAGWDASLFVNNLLNSRDILSITGGRQTCANTASCTTYSVLDPFLSISTQRPREGGLQVSRRF